MRSSRGISEEHRGHWPATPAGPAVLPKALYVHAQAREECPSPPNMKMYLLSLASPAHPRFKAEQAHFWKIAVSEIKTDAKTLHEVTLVTESAAAFKRAPSYSACSGISAQVE